MAIPGETVQAAMWYLLSDATRWMSDDEFMYTPYMELVNAADPDFEPTECGQKVLVLVYQTGESTNLCDDIEIQVLAIEVDVDCEEVPCSEDIIAWALTLPLDGTSELIIS